MNTGDLNKVWEIRALKKKPRGDEATKILEKIAKQVQPIMRNHNWRVKILSEMCPKNASLLGLNVGRGVHVKLRLRRANNDLDFIPFDQVLDTMLHELCHNAHGPHNASFYKLWDDLRKECEDLMSRGVSGTGQGFDLPGRRLGGFSWQPPLSSLRQTALAAAQKRERLGSLLPSGPKRLGGDNSIMSALSPIQAAAMAAERRLQDDIWCASGDLVEEEETSSDYLRKDAVQSPKKTSTGIDSHADVKSHKRSRESNPTFSSQSCSSCSGSSFVDLTAVASSSGSAHEYSESTQKRSRQTDSNSSGSHPESCFIDLSTDPSKFEREESSAWECLMCTFLNPPLAPLCDICGAQKPKDVETKNRIWSCKFCTLENSVTIEKCTACGQWRYSHGQPIATYAPNLGT